jgi:hypothetical protein
MGVGEGWAYSIGGWVRNGLSASHLFEMWGTRHPAAAKENENDRPLSHLPAFIPVTIYI